VRGYQEGAQLDEVAVLRVLHVDHTPRILATPHLLAGHLQNGIAADHGERDGGLQLAILLLEVVVLVGIALGELVQLDVVVLQVLQDALLQLAHLLLVETVGLADHQHDVHLAVQPSDQVEVHLSQAGRIKQDFSLNL